MLSNCWFSEAFDQQQSEVMGFASRQLCSFYLSTHLEEAQVGVGGQGKLARAPDYPPDYLLFVGEAQIQKCMEQHCA